MSLFKYDPKLIKHKGRYNARFYDPETRRRFWHALGTDNKSVASRRFREIVRAYELGEFDPSRDKYQFGSMTLRKAADGFLSSRKSDWAATTYRDYDAFLNLVCETLPADVHLRHLSPSDCRKIIRHPPARASQRGYYRRLRAFLNWCMKQGYIKTSPLEDVKQPKKEADDRRPFLTRDEFAKLIDKINADAAGDEKLVRLSRALRFDVATGLRLAELRKLRWRDVDYHSRRIHVIGKRDKYRTVPLFPDAAAVLDEIAAEHREQFGEAPHSELEVFPGLPQTDTSHLVTDYLIKTNLKEKVGMKAVHVFRFTFASWCVMAGVDIYTVSKWLGHESVTTTEVYAHLAPDYAPAAAVEAFGGKSSKMVE